MNIKAIDQACPTWTKLQSASEDGSGTTFTVQDPAFASCLKPGDKIVVASDTQSSSNYDTGIVASVDAIAGTITTTTIINSVDGFATLDSLVSGEEMLAVEIASLNRQVIFEGQNDIPDATTPEIVHGGHLI